jgi:hypothetical protein
MTYESKENRKNRRKKKKTANLKPAGMPETSNIEEITSKKEIEKKTLPEIEGRKGSLCLLFLLKLGGPVRKGRVPS